MLSTLSWLMLWSQWVTIGTSSGVSYFFPDCSLSRRSCLGSPHHPGTSMKASTFLFSSLSLSSRFIASMYTSTPLLRNSYLPLVETMRVLSSRSVPSRALATSSTFFLAAFLLRVKVAPFGMKSSSKPLGSITSTGLSSSSLHSFAVIWLTVVKQSTLCAVCFSMECLLCMFSSAAIWSPL